MKVQVCVSEGACVCVCVCMCTSAGVCVCVSERDPFSGDKSRRHTTA